MSWRKAFIGECTTLVSRGKTPKYGESDNVRAVKSAQVYPKRIKWEQCPSLSNEFVLKCNEKFYLKEGDVLLNGTGTGTLGRPGIVLNKPIGEFVPDSHVTLIRPNAKLASKFLFYWLLSPYGKIVINKSYTGSTNQIELSASRVAKFKIPLPPLPEQKRIANILDKADQVRQLNQQVLAQYDALTQSLFLDMFGDPVVNPMSWERVKLDNILEFLTSGSRGWAKYYSMSGSIFLRIQNIGYNKLKLDDLTYVNAPESAETKRTLVQTGDVLLSITADLGRTAVIPDNFPIANINQHLALLRIKKSFNPAFVSSYIASKGGQSFFRKLDKGGVKAGLNFSDIRSYKLFNVPEDLQNQFAQKVKNIEAQKAKAQAALAASEDLFNNLLQKAFKGEL
ncbi:MAG: restriction endonuclease subunit S [Aureispira sp.]